MRRLLVVLQALLSSWSLKCVCLADSFEFILRLALSAFRSTKIPIVTHGFSFVSLGLVAYIKSSIQQPSPVYRELHLSGCLTPPSPVRPSLKGRMLVLSPPTLPLLKPIPSRRCSSAGRLNPRRTICRTPSGVGTPRTPRYGEMFCAQSYAQPLTLSHVGQRYQGEVLMYARILAGCRCSIVSRLRSSSGKSQCLHSFDLFASRK